MKTWLIVAGLIGIGCLALFGGSWFSEENSENPEVLVDEEPDFSELEDLDPEKLEPPMADGATLELHLPPHEPLPLMKTVEQVLVQKTQDGERVSHSSLELAVTLRLEEKAQDGSQLLSVVYNRVRYRQDVAGRTFVFDSTVPNPQLPVEALPYKGLVGNGFSFWIGKNHRIVKPVGFADFLKRCIREVPPAQQQRVLMAFSDAADEGVANFVDDSFAFLPPDPHVKEEATWTRERRLTKPIPIFLNSQCTLKRMTDQYAEIDIDGTIATTKTFAPKNVQPSDLQVIVRGGRSKGRCEIDRKTGLPLHSEIKRYVDMEVKTADGQRFDQQKITTTTIRLFPQQSSGSSSPVIHAGAIVPANN